MLKCPVNYCLVEIEKKFQDTQGDIAVDTTWTPEEYATLEGTVASVPAVIREDEYRNIFGEVKVGDKVIFSYGIVFDYLSQPDNDTPVYRNLVFFEGKEYWKVDVAEIFCTVSPEGEISMVTDNALLERYVSRGNIEQLIPGFEIFDDKEHLVSVKAMPKNSNISCSMGDVVAVEPKYLQKYNILGQEHFIIPTRRILANMLINGS